MRRLLRRRSADSKKDNPSDPHYGRQAFAQSQPVPQSSDQWRRDYPAHPDHYTDNEPGTSRGPVRYLDSQHLSNPHSAPSCFPAPNNDFGTCIGDPYQAAIGDPYQAAPIFSPNTTAQNAGGKRSIPLPPRVSTQDSNSPLAANPSAAGPRRSAPASAPTSGAAASAAAAAAAAMRHNHLGPAPTPGGGPRSMLSPNASSAPAPLALQSTTSGPRSSQALARASMSDTIDADSEIVMFSPVAPAAPQPARQSNSAVNNLTTTKGRTSSAAARSRPASAPVGNEIVSQPRAAPPAAASAGTPMTSPITSPLTSDYITYTRLLQSQICDRFGTPHPSPDAPRDELRQRLAADVHHGYVRASPSQLGYHVLSSQQHLAAMQSCLQREGLAPSRGPKHESRRRGVFGAISSAVRGNSAMASAAAANPASALAPTVMAPAHSSGGSRGYGHAGGGTSGVEYPPCMGLPILLAEPLDPRFEAMASAMEVQLKAATNRDIAAMKR